MNSVFRKVVQVRARRPSTRPSPSPPQPTLSTLPTLDAPAALAVPDTARRSARPCATRPCARSTPPSALGWSASLPSSSPALSRRRAGMWTRSGGRGT
jgi:hypothetical protein